jgi:hypothetical protein
MPAGMWTEQIPNTSLQHYRHTSLLSLPTYKHRMLQLPNIPSNVNGTNQAVLSETIISTQNSKMICKQAEN